MVEKQVKNKQRGEILEVKIFKQEGNRRMGEKKWGWLNKMKGL